MIEMFIGFFWSIPDGSTVPSEEFFLKKNSSMNGSSTTSITKHSPCGEWDSTDFV